MSGKAAKCPELARQQKRKANARHRARKKAAQAQTEWALAATAAELERERGRTAELLHEQEALHKMSAYQEQAAQLLDFAALAEKLEGELTLYPGGAPAGTVVGSSAGSVQGMQMQATLAALGVSMQPGSEVASAVPGSGGGMQTFEAALAALGGSGMGGGQPAAPAAALDELAADSLELDEALAELADADLSLLLQQAQGQPGDLGSAEKDWLDALQWVDEPLQPQQVQPQLQTLQLPQQQRPQQPLQQQQRVQPPLQTLQLPQQQQPQQPLQQQQRVQPSAISLQALVQQEREEGGLLRELVRRFFSHSAGGTTLMAHFWAQYPLQPPPWLLRLVASALRLAPVSVMEHNSRQFLQHMQSSVQRWDACPGSRRQIEEILAARLADRQYFMRCMAHHRPADILAVWCKFACPSPPAGAACPDGRPPVHSALLPAAQYLEASLTSKQLGQLHEAWQRFLHGCQAAQQRRDSATARLHHAAALQSVSWQKQSTQPSGGCTAERSEAFCSMAEGTGGLAVEARDLLLRLLDLQGALLRVLTPIQMARVVSASRPYFPDLAQIGPWLFARPGGAAELADSPAPHSSVGASGVGQPRAADPAAAAAAGSGSESGSVQAEAYDSPLPVGYADVLLEGRLQSNVELISGSKLACSDAPAVSCRSGGSGRDPAHLLASAASLSMAGL